MAIDGQEELSTSPRLQMELTQSSRQVASWDPLSIGSLVHAFNHRASWLVRDARKGEGIPNLKHSQYGSTDSCAHVAINLLPSRNLSEIISASSEADSSAILGKVCGKLGFEIFPGLFRVRPGINLVKACNHFA